MPLNAPFRAATSLSRWIDSSAKTGRGLRSVTQAIASSCSLGIGCSIMTIPFSWSQWIMSSACCLSFQPWLASMAMGRSVTERMVSIISLSLSRPNFTLRMLKRSAHSRVFWRTTSGVSIPMVKVVDGVFFGSSPQMRYQGAPNSLPTKSCSAMSTAAFAAALPVDKESIWLRISSNWKGSGNSLMRVCTCAKKACTLSKVPSSCWR